MTALSSMTAFARASVTLPQGALAWEVKTVNSKGLDLRLRLPPGFDREDAWCRARVAGVIARGSVQATLSLQTVAAAPQVRVDAALLRDLIEAVGAAIPQGSRLAPPTLDGLLAVRGVVEIVDRAEAPADQATVSAALRDLLAEALRGLLAVREREGQALGALLNEHLAAIAALTEAAVRAPGRAPAAVAARLARAVEVLVGSTSSLDPARLHQEAILIAGRADVREELDRLRIHTAAALALLSEGGPAGRRLDFLAQELAREANTLCAKSGDADLTAIGLDLRSRIEQLREQVQNLE